MVLVDTDIFIDFLRNNTAAREFIERHLHEISFSAITEAELLSGQECDTKDVREKLLHFLSQFEKIPVDNPLVQVAGEFRRSFGIDLPDAIIAATAFMIDEPLCTRNIKHFEKVKSIYVTKPY